MADKDPDQWWFWTEEWQKGESEADADLAAGRSTYYDSDEAFLDSLSGSLFTDIEQWEKDMARRLKQDKKADKKAAKAHRKQLKFRAEVLESLVGVFMEENPEPGVEMVRLFLEPWLSGKGVKLLWAEEYEELQDEIEALGG